MSPSLQLGVGRFYEGELWAGRVQPDNPTPVETCVCILVCDSLFLKMSVGVNSKRFRFGFDKNKLGQHVRKR
jgi:hypothetical protein